MEKRKRTRIQNMIKKEGTPVEFKQLFLIKVRRMFGSWYNEYHGHIRIHDYISIMVNQFPIFVIRRYDNPHSKNEDMDRSVHMGILGFSFKIK